MSNSPITNPFGLVYGGAIEANESGRVNIRPVRYELDGIEVAANLYLPADYNEKSICTHCRCFFVALRVEG